MCAPTSERRRRSPYISKHYMLKDDDRTYTQVNAFTATRACICSHKVSPPKLGTRNLVRA